MSFAESLYQRLPTGLQTLALNAAAWRIERHRYGAAYRAVLRGLRESERWPRERLRAEQDARLREIVAFAYARSAYYGALFDGLGLRPGDIRGTADLAKLPLLDKETVRSRGEELMTAGRPERSWLHGHTSGTTGSPLGLWYDRETCIWNNAVDGRQKAWGGMGEDDWIGLFLGRVVVPTGQTRPPFWRTNWVQRQVWFSSFHMDEAALDRYVDEIRRRKLRFLEGYPSTLYILANHVLRKGERLPLGAVFSSSETVHRLQKEVIEKAFECRLFDFYGLAERVIFASECEAHEGRHLAEEYGVTELVDEAGDPVAEGRPGYLVGTSLHNRAMPMLRYRTNDVSAILVEPCPCGRSARRLRDVTTKAEDIVVTPEGRLVAPSILTHPFKPFPQIVKSQIVQEEIDRLLVRIVPSRSFDPACRDELIAGLRERLGPGMAIEVRLVDDIPRSASGKFRWVVSHVQHAASLSWEDAGGAQWE